MKLARLVIKLIISILLLFNVNILANEEIKHDFYIYNTTIEYDAHSNNVLVFNRETKKIKYQKNSEVKVYPASLTKIMTAIVAIENIKNFEDIVAIDKETYYQMLEKNSSMAGFAINELVSFNDLLYGTILSSGGEAANSLAVNVAGSVDAFVKLMNDKAQELDMTNTKFTNVEGLDDLNQYSSAKDMVKLLDYALDNRHFKEVFTSLNYQTSKTNYHPQGLTLTSTVFSHLVDFKNTDFTIIGGKSGTTFSAGYNWATLGIKNNIEYISVVMGSFDDKSQTKHIEDTLNIFQLINESTD